MTTELTYDSTKVLPANSKTTTATGVSGAAITAGQVVWLDTSVTPNQLKPAKADSSTGQSQGQNIVGIALDTTTGANQAVTYATSGDVLLPSSGAHPLAAGTVYAVSDSTAGNLATASTLTSGSFTTVVGMAVSTAIFRIGFNPVAAKI